MFNVVQHENKVLIKTDKQLKPEYKVLGQISDQPEKYPIIDFFYGSRKYYIVLALCGVAYEVKDESFLKKLKDKTLELKNGISNIEFIPINNKGKIELVELNGKRYNEIIKKQSIKIIPKNKILAGHVYTNRYGQECHIIKNNKDSKIYFAEFSYNNYYFNSLITSNFVSKSNNSYDNNLKNILLQKINDPYNKGYCTARLKEFL